MVITVTQSGRMAIVLATILLAVQEIPELLYLTTFHC